MTNDGVTQSEGSVPFTRTDNAWLALFTESHGWIGVRSTGKTPELDEACRRQFKSRDFGGVCFGTDLNCATCGLVKHAFYLSEAKATCETCDKRRDLSPQERSQIFAAIEELGVLIERAYKAERLPMLRDGHLTVMSSLPYQAVREALYKNTFKEVEGSPWPTARLEKGTARGHAQLRPAAVDGQPLVDPEEVAILSKLMWRQREELTDLDADALDALSAVWLAQAQSPEEDAIADISELLAMRGVTPRYNSEGRVGGYRPDQRNEMLKALSHIQNLWINMAEVDVLEESTDGRQSMNPARHSIQSRAFVITDRMGQLRLDGYMDVRKFIFRPGKVFAYFLFGPGRQTALLSARALQYDPYRQKWEKRLARYLSWQWQRQPHSHSQPFRIETLMEAVGEDLINERFPQRSRERLESALDTLREDGVISAWQYDRWEESIAERRRWIALWMQATILLEPPEAIREVYKRLAPVEVLRKKELAASNSALGELIKRKRKSLKLSQSGLAESLGISQAYVSNLEQGKVHDANISSSIRDTLLRWLKEENG